MESWRRKIADRLGISNEAENFGNPGSYSEKTLRQYWMPDQVAVECYDCASKFSTFRRKHHCRICGQIFCNRCCGTFIDGRVINFNGSIRVCNPCHQFILKNPAERLPEYAAERNNSRRESLASLDERAQRFSHLATKSGSDSDLTSDLSTSSPRLNVRRKSSYAGMMVPTTFLSESCDNISDLGSLKPLELPKLVMMWQKMSTLQPIPTRSHKYKFKVYKDTFLGEDLIQWLKENEGISETRRATEIAQGLLDGQLIIDPTDMFQNSNLTGVFSKGVPYRLKEARQRVLAENIEEENEIIADDMPETDDLAPDWLQSVEKHKKATNIPKPSESALSRRNHITSSDQISPANHEDLKQILSKKMLTIGLSSDTPSAALDKVYSRYHAHYLDQLLTVEKLDLKKWRKFIQINGDKLLEEVILEPFVTEGQVLMDITDLIKIKCISKGTQKDSRIVKGEVFSNRVIRTDMPMSATKVRLLLVEESISYHRTDKFVSIGNLHKVEEEFVKNICNKIKALKPDLILVGENVVRRAQDELAKAGISVIQNVKGKNLARIARLFGTNILPSLASMVTIPTLGTCEQFHSVYHEHEDKNLIYLEDAGMPKQCGCSFILRGGTRSELAKVKRVMKQYLFFKTHAEFEKAFILDESSQEDNFIVPDYNASHVSLLSLSPFIELSLPEDDTEAFIKAIDDDCAAIKEDFEDEIDGVKPPPVVAKVKPFALTTTVQNDVNVRNMIADMRAAPVKVNPVWKPKFAPLPAAPKLYQVINRSLPISYSSYLVSNAASGGGSKFCVKPRVMMMKCYRENDMSLGTFLTHYCFDKTVRCMSIQDMPSTGFTSSNIATNSAAGKAASPCQISITNHGRRFNLGNTSINLIITDYHQTLTNVKQDDPDQIVMWKFCPHCKTMSPMIQLSNEAKKMSFGMFLLLLISESKMLRKNIIACPHSLHNTQYTTFGRQKQLAFFYVDKICAHGVKMPPEKIGLPDHLPSEKELRDDLSKLSALGSGVYGQLNEKLVQLQTEFDNSCVAPMVVINAVRELSNDQQAHFANHKLKVERIHENLEVTKDLIQAQSDILMLQISIMRDVLAWRLRLSKFFELKRKEEKLFSKSSSSKSRMASGSNSLLVTEDEKMLSSLPAIPTSAAASASGSEVKITKEDKKGSVGNIPALTEQDVGTLDSPFAMTLHPDLYLKPYIIVDENQPSSIIAYALGSTEHAEFLFTNADARKSLDYQFTDNGGSDKFFVKVHCAAEFHNFRKKIFQSGHDHQDFLASLARCDPWQSSGGKSGASFYKTADGRFLLKQINHHEIETLKNVVLRYFDYITNSDHRSLMAKIVGLYTVGYKTSNGGQRHDLIILENLFYKHNIVESFDLKGSMRNRYVDSSGDKLQGKDQVVLMDENLLRMACARPFYVTNKTKNRLKQAVERDAQFLTDIKVMDYSLLVGIDKGTNELVVGIIDFLRPFSIDKVIESSFKKTTGYMQGTAEEPTVISPSAYQSRFIAAMDNYFILLPDYWYEPPK